MDPFTEFRVEAEECLLRAARSIGHDGDLQFEEPPEGMGDLACACFPLARSLRKAPAAIAEDLAAALDLEGAQWIERARVAGPYVNLYLDTAKVAAQVLVDPAAAITAVPLGKRVLVEHTSANPNGPLHVGRARNPILGDTLVRLHRAAGYDVDAHYYMDNLGRQVAQLYWGHKHIDAASLPPAGRDKADHDLVRYYQAANERRESDPETAQEIKELVAHLETAPADLLRDVRTVYEACFSGMRASLERLGVAFDSVDDESDHVQDGSVDRVIQALKQSPRHGEDDGAHYLDMSEELKGNKSTKFFFTRSDGTSVYATRDVAYHQWKAQQGADRLIDVLGEDHRLQSLQVGIALDELKAQRPEVVFYAFVSLPEGKMSTRANRVVFLDDLLDEAHDLAFQEVKSRRGHELDDEDMHAIAEAVGMAAVRFNIARIQPEKPIKFRWEEALSFDGDSAPYVQYAHARAASLLGAAKDAGLDVDTAPGAPPGDGEIRLLATVARFVGSARQAADRCAPQIFTAYAVRLASAFNDYYRDHPVVSCEDADLRATRIATVRAAQSALAAVHDALGLPLLDAM